MTVLLIIAAVVLGIGLTLIGLYLYIQWRLNHLGD